MAMKFTNNATTTLASTITSIATSLTVAGGDGALFPTLTASDYFYCTLANSSGTIEIIKVTARSTDTFTITRAQDNTVASAFTAGDKVELRLVAASLNDLPKLDEANTFSAANTFSTTLGITGVATFSAQPIFSSLTASSAVATDASRGLVSVTNTGTGNNVLATTPTIATPSISSPTISDGTANGVAYLNGSKVLTTGTALAFNGSKLGIGTTSFDAPLQIQAITGGTSVRFNGRASPADGYTDLAFYNSANTAQYAGIGAANSGLILATTISSPIQFQTNNAEVGRFDASGNLLVGTTSTLTSSATAKVHVNGSIVAGNSDSGYSATSGVQQLMHKPAAEGNVTNAFGNNGTTGFQIVFASVASYGASTANSGIALGKNSSTNRSINAGGTINASGADYAEYMTKAGDFIVAKGDVVGINADGKLTNVYADAVSFVVKSTDPSYVGGDTWGVVEQTADNKKPPLTPEALEAARQLVDRIAFAGQVPVNVLGATAGQYIIPVNDNGAIKGEAVTSPTFEQYQTAVGKVIAIEADGRAKIIVKVA